MTPDPTLTRAALARLRAAAAIALLAAPLAHAGGTSYIDTEMLQSFANTVAAREQAAERAVGREQFRQLLRDLRTGAEAAGKFGSAASATLGAWEAWRDSNEALSELDRALDAGMADGSDMPAVPSSCVANDSAECSSCFETAYGRVNFARMTMERLRTIHTRTIKYIKAKESFGDSVAPIHGISGLAWQGARSGIEKERATFNATSKKKFNELVGTMESALKDVAACEAQHFDNPDWYTRYGFMYMQAIKTAYEPVDGG